jgi:sugar phosphate isomerase/epimerase
MAMSNLNQNHRIFSSVPVMDRPLLDRLPAVRAAGFDGLSLLPNDLWALEEQGVPPEAVAKRIADEGLLVCEVDCIASWLPAHKSLQTDDPMLKSLQTSHVAERVMEAAARVGARSVAVVEIFGVVPQIDEAAEAFAALCDMAAAYDLLVHLEFAPFGGISNLQQALAILKACNRANAGLTLDSWHLFRSGGSIAELADVPAHFIHTVQLNDAPVEPWPDVFAETMNGRLLPGDGSFDLIGLIQTLDRIGSTAPLEVEVFHPCQADQDLETIARRWHGALLTTLNRAGRKN